MSFRKRQKEKGTGERSRGRDPGRGVLRGVQSEARGQGQSELVSRLDLSDRHASRLDLGGAPVFVSFFFVGLQIRADQSEGSRMGDVIGTGGGFVLVAWGPEGGLCGTGKGTLREGVAMGWDRSLPSSNLGGSGRREGGGRKEHTARRGVGLWLTADADAARVGRSAGRLVG